MKENFFSSNNEISNVDVESVKDHFQDLKYVTPCLYYFNNVQFEKKLERIGILGTDENFLNANNDTLLEGRFLCTEDIVGQKRVCVISSSIKHNFYKKNRVIGENVTINNEEFVIIGVLAKKETPILEAIRSVKEGNNEGIYIPITILQEWNKTTNINYLQAQLSPKKSQEVLERLKNYLSIRHHSIPKFETESMQTYVKVSNKIMGTLKMIFAIIATISLFVGGLGIMNIMLISVKERTKEIGIRKAVGATDLDIVFQFLIESVIISFIGGSIGIIVGLSGIYIIAQIVKVGSLVSIESILIAFGASIFIGMTAGIYPALQAACLDPINALRYE